MGGSLSKSSSSNNVHSLINNVANSNLPRGEILDIIVVNFILTMNYRDMVQLSSKQYCNKLVKLLQRLLKREFKDDLLHLKTRITKGTLNMKQANKSDYSNSLNRKKIKSLSNEIAQFYITIAHVYAAIAKAINPVFTYTEDGTSYNYTMLDKDTIPSDVVPNLFKNSPCNRQGVDDEEGIPELDRLYYDHYNHKLGDFDRITSDGVSHTEYYNDLGDFYTAFTERDDYTTWNRHRTKRFSDIQLSMCAVHNDVYPDMHANMYNNTYRGTPIDDTAISHTEHTKTNPFTIQSNTLSSSLSTSKSPDNENLFVLYANHLKNMIQNAEHTQTILTKILKNIFKIQTSDSEGVSPVLTLSPTLTTQVLETKIIPSARRHIIKTYIQCEQNLYEGLEILKRISYARKIKQIPLQMEELFNVQANLLNS